MRSIHELLDRNSTQDGNSFPPQFTLHWRQWVCARKWGECMPRSLKFFLLFLACFCLWRAWLNFNYLLLPDPRRLANLATFPAALRAEVERAEWIAAGVRLIIQIVPLIVFGIFAAVLRRNWARVGVVLLLIATEAWLAGYAAALYYGWPRLFHFTFFSWDGVWQHWLQTWTWWRHWISAGLELAMLVSLFAPGTRSWFARHGT